jgi:hypothetical protein
MHGVNIKLAKNNYNIQNAQASVSISWSPCHAFVEPQGSQGHSLKNTDVQVAACMSIHILSMCTWAISVVLKCSSVARVLRKQTIQGPGFI